MSLVMTHVSNMITHAVTSFTEYSYNSMTRFQGKYLGASDAGLFQLDDAASTEVLTGTIKTAELHFGSEFQKRCSDFFLAMRTKGAITLTVDTDEMGAYSYTIEPWGVDRLKQRRTAIGKGAKGKYWTFTLECPEQFDYDTMNIMMVVVSRRL